jgi:hypothetical protein
MRVTFLAFVILTGFAMAQQPRNADAGNLSQAEKKFASLEGKLIDAATSEPVRKANLVLIQTPRAGGGMTMAGPPPGTAVSSDAEGKFSFPKLEPGRYMLSADKAGYVRQQYGTRAGQFGPGTNLVLEPGQKIANIEFKLMRQGVITGKVVDEDGEPVPHTMVSVLRRTPSSRRAMGMMGTATNDVGEFRIASLPPGRYLLRAEQQGGRMFGAPPLASADAKVEGTLGFVPTYYPGVTDEASAGEIVVAAGQQISGIDIGLRKGRVFQVSGRIKGVPAGATRIQVNLQARRTARDGMMFGFGGGGNVKPDGTFSLPSVMPGSWDMVAMSLESGRPQMLGRAPVTVTNLNVEDLVIEPRSLLELAGRVTLEGAAEQQDNVKAGLAGQQDNSKTSVVGQVMLQPMQPFPAFIEPGRIQPDGTFKISGVSRDQYTVHVMGLSGEQYIKSVRAGDVDVTTTGLDLSTADTAPRIEIRVRAKGATVSGVVLDGDKPSPGAIVTALTQPYKPELRSPMLKTATTDQNGGFTLQGLAPGEYRIYASDSYLTLNDPDPEQLKSLEKFAAVVKLKEEAREQVELKLAPTAQD